ncbi:MAG: hypothetical protein Tsb0021_06650 [Chlamydiales bacterium]
MESFDKLLKILDTLLGPEGCPWDREQTLESLRSTVLEETCELIEAINLKNRQGIIEELGDVLFNVLFFCKLGEKNGLFSTTDVISEISCKLVRRHPHVFSNAVAHTSDHVVAQWEAIKSQEKKQHRKSALDGIPHELPALLRTFKVIKKISKQNYSLAQKKHSSTSEESIGRRLFILAQEAANEHIDPEQALRLFLTNIEQDFRKWESDKNDES